MQDVRKTWKALKLFAEDVGYGASRGNIEIVADYQVDDDTVWTKIGAFNRVPVHERDLNTTLPTSRRIRFRLRFYTNDVNETPRLKAAVVEGVAFVPVKQSYSFQFQIFEGDMDIDLEGDESVTMTTVEDRHADLQTWANTGSHLTWRCNLSPIDNKTVFIDPISFQPIVNVPGEQMEGHIGYMSVTEM
jgi:hypothetical protein